MNSDLPPANPSAHGLHLTDLELEGIMAFVRSHSMIEKAWVYGSRRSGQRRPKEQYEPPDVDIAVELADVQADELSNAMLEVRYAAWTFFVFVHPEYGLSTSKGGPGFVQIEFPKEAPTVAAYIAEGGATLIFERRPDG